MYINCYNCLFAASQMNLLGHLLPLITGDFILEDDQHWKLFLQLMDIVDILFSPTTSADFAAYVSTFISDHHHEFCKLYPEHRVIPKMHFMVHMPQLMIQ